MRVSQAMTRDVRIADPEQSIQQAARVMAAIDVAALPVGENDRLVGMIADLDIAARAVAEGKSPDAKARDVMTKDIKYCFADQDVDDVSQNLGDIRVRRLGALGDGHRRTPVVFSGKRRAARQSVPSPARPASRSPEPAASRCSVSPAFPLAGNPASLAPRND